MNGVIRKRTVEELLSTEQKHCHDLQTIATVYVKGLEDAGWAPAAMCCHAICYDLMCFLCHVVCSAMM